MIEPSRLRNFAIANIRYEDWEILIADHTILIRRGSRAWSGEVGTLLLLRRTRDPNRQNGVMGIWFIVHLQSNRRFPNLYQNIRILIHVRPIIQFVEPFDEDLTRGPIGGVYSRRIRDLTLLPYLSIPLFPMIRTGKSYEILKNYLKEILRDKQEEATLNNISYGNIITDNIVSYYINQLGYYVDNYLNNLPAI